jgi:ubiquinone/menaquinone biosynthesis C-methylase UbiE
MRRPRFIAEQARHAKGLLGRAIAAIMARETWAENRRAIAALGVEASDWVLDVGSGPGRSLAALAGLASRGRVAGVDPSHLMAEIATRRNRALVAAGRVEIVVAGAASLPFADGTFDKALCVHVIYFWDDMQAALREIARVMKPGGRLALVFRTGADEAAVRNFPAGVYRFPALCDVVKELEAAGFSVDVGKAVRDEHSGPVLLTAVKRHIDA